MQQLVLLRKHSEKLYKSYVHSYSMTFKLLYKNFLNTQTLNILSIYTSIIFHNNTQSPTWEKPTKSVRNRWNHLLSEPGLFVLEVFVKEIILSVEVNHFAIEFQRLFIE